MKNLLKPFEWIGKANKWFRGRVRAFNLRMKNRYEPAKLALVAVAVMAIGFAVQLMLPPYLGVSNDGSYDAVLADCGLSRLNPGDADAYFSYYEREYAISSEFHGEGKTAFLLKFFIRAAVFIDTLFTQDLVFDMRFLAGIYGLLYLTASYLLIKAILQRAAFYAEGVALAVVCVLILGDSALVTRFASLYTQPLEWLLLMGIVDSVFAISNKKGHGMGSLCMCAMTILLMTLNPYTALGGIVFSMVLWRLIAMKLGSVMRAACGFMAVLLTAVSVFSFAKLNSEMTLEQKYNQMTRGVLFQAEDPAKALEEFGIEPRYSVLADTYADQNFPVAYMDSSALKEGFFDRYNTKEVLVYYLRHPTALLGLFDIGIQASFAARPGYSGNFEKSVGLPPMAKSQFLTVWSTFKEQTAPKTVGSVFIVVMVLVLLRRRKKDKRSEEIAMSRSLLDVVLFFAAVELCTVLVLTGDSELVRESFLMGAEVDLLIIVFITETLNKTNVIGQEE